MGRLTTTEIMTRMRRTTSTATCLTWTQTWSVWTRTSTPTEDSWVSVVSLCLIPCTSHCGSRLKICVCASFIMSHAHVEWLSLSSTSPPTSLSFSSSSIASSTSFCSSPSLRLSWQQPGALPLRSRVVRQKDYNFSLWSLLWEPAKSFRCQVMSPATVPRRLGLRRHRYRSDAFQRVPKTSRSLRTRRPVFWSVVVNVSR